MSEQSLREVLERLLMTMGGAATVSTSTLRNLLAAHPAEADVALELARTMPTRQDLAKVVHDAVHGRLQCSGPRCVIWDEAYKQADAVLALINGGAK